MADNITLYYADYRFSCPSCHRYLIRWFFVDGNLYNLGGHEPYPYCNIEDYKYMWE